MSKTKPTPRRKSPSPKERARRQEQRAASVRQLLYSREQTGKALGGISISSVIRLEMEGKLRKIRLRGETGQVFNPVEDVEALASGVANASANT